MWSYHGLARQARICTFRTWPEPALLVTFILSMLLLKGLAGPYQNKHFKIAAGMSLGRRQGEILLEEDNTISSLHGRVISLPGGQLCLNDAGSQNQFLVNGKRTSRVDLVEGSVFQVGQCIFQVISASEKQAAGFSMEKSWKDVVFSALENNISTGPSKARAFNPPVRVECIRGPSAEISWFLGFGPRLFGPLCEDIEILEKDSGDVAFEISQNETGPAFTSHSKNVLINSLQATEKQLEDGDEIQVGSSLFRIRLGS